MRLSKRVNISHPSPSEQETTFAILLLTHLVTCRQGAGAAQHLSGFVDQHFSLLIAFKLKRHCVCNC